MEEANSNLYLANNEVDIANKKVSDLETELEEEKKKNANLERKFMKVESQINDIKKLITI